jgi:hypothetical protein
MKQSAFLLGVLLFLTGTAGAQSNSDNPTADSSAWSAAGAATASQDTSVQPLFALAAEPSNSAPNTPSSEAAPAPAQISTQPGQVQGVFPEYNWQAYLGYTFVHFNEGSGFNPNLNGFNMALDYFRHTGALGIDGELVAGFGSQARFLGELWAGMGGARYRFVAPRGLQVWVHGLVGGAKFVPQTAIGNEGQTGLAYEAGAGVDVGAWNHRFAFRFAGDLLGTRIFGQNQFNPKVSAGIVFKY